MSKQRITANLPPCPFCDGKAIGEAWVADLKVLRAFIRCQKCGCKTKTMEQMPFESKEDVIKAAINSWCSRTHHVGAWVWYTERYGNPIDGYEYESGWKCTLCGKTLPDPFVDYDAPPDIPFCPHCGSNNAARQTATQEKRDKKEIEGAPL